MSKYFLFIILFCTSCSSYTESPYLPFVRQVRREAIAFGKSRANVRVEGTGGQLFCGVRQIWIGFGSDQTYDVDTARRHFMILAQDLMQRVEACSALRPYLKEPKKIEWVPSISLSYTNKIRNEDVRKPVALIILLNGKIHYCANDAYKSCYIDIHTETYEEALEILRRENSNI